MNDLPSSAALQAAPPSPVFTFGVAGNVFAAAKLLLPHLERGRPVDSGVLRAAMEAAFSASDATGAWDWKTAYDACEAATVLFLRKYGKALFHKAGSPAAALPTQASFPPIRAIPRRARRFSSSPPRSRSVSPRYAPPRSRRETAFWSRLPEPDFSPS
jgi:hypothetical protein